MLTYLIVILAALAPAIFLFIYMQEEDARNPEPRKLLKKGIRYGVYSALAVIAVMSPFREDAIAEILGPVRGNIFTAFFSAAIPEETAKLFFIWLLLRHNRHFDEHLDGVVYATCVGLGFAGFENILYLFTNIDNFVSVAVTRALFSVPGHFFFAVSMGYFISLAHFKGRTIGQKIFFYFLAWAVPVLLHGIFDSILMVSDALSPISGILFIAFLVFCHFLRKLGRSKISELQLRDRYNY